ncbi:MAG TPA: hypothetical protein VF905_14145 [Nitrospirota bacterium]
MGKPDLVGEYTLFNSTNTGTGNVDGTATVFGGTSGTTKYSAPVPIYASKFFAVKYKAKSASSGTINLTFDIQVSDDRGGYQDGLQSYASTAYASDTFALDALNTSPMFSVATADDSTWKYATVQLPPAKYARAVVTKAAGNAADVIFDLKLIVNPS